MVGWAEHILGYFTADIARLWVVCDPDAVLLDETLLSALRARGFEVLPYEDPFAFRAEYEERYRAPWDRGEPGPTPALVVHLRDAEVNALPWDLVHQARTVRLSLAELFPRLASRVVRQVEPAQLAQLYQAHQTELQSFRGELESQDFILDHVYQLAPRAIRTPVDFWREALRLHYAERALPPLFAQYAADIIQGRGLFPDQPVATWLASKSALLRVVQGAWPRFLATQGLAGAPAVDLPLPPGGTGPDIPFAHPDVQVLVDSLFLDGTLRPLAVDQMPSGMPSWLKVGIVPDPAAQVAVVARAMDDLLATLPAPTAAYKEWLAFAPRYGELLARLHELSGADGSGDLTALDARLVTLQAQADAHLQAWVAAHYADLILQPATKGPVMVHHVPRFLRHRRAAGESRVALLVFDGLACDQWVPIREHLRAAPPGFAFDEGATFAWLPTVTAVSRQALFSGLKPREFAAFCDRTDRDESGWKTFWQNEGVNPAAVLYRRKLRQREQLAALEATLLERRPEVVGLVIDAVDDRLHKECSKPDVARWLRHWLASGFVDRLCALLLDQHYHIYLTADHGNVAATGGGRPNQGVIAEGRGERVRVYRSESLLAASAAAYPDTLRLAIPGLPADFLPLFAGERTAFVTSGEQMVVHGGVSVEELIVPFVKVCYDRGAA